MTRDRYGRSDEGGFSRRRDEADTNTYDRDRSYRRPFSRTREYDYDESYRRDRERFEAGQRDYAGGRGEYGGRSEYPYNESRNLGEEGYGYQGDTRWREGNEFRDRGRRGGFSEQRERGGASRSHVKCRDIMTRDVTCATRDSTLREVATMMRDEDTGVIPVVERIADATIGTVTEGDGRAANRIRNNGQLVGLITDRDIVIRAVANGQDVNTRADEIMTGDIHTARPNDRVIDVIRKMGDKQVRRIPVVDENDNLVGIISMADVALETENDRELADALEEISSGASFWGKIFG